MDRRRTSSASSRCSSCWKRRSIAESIMSNEPSHYSLYQAQPVLRMRCPALCGARCLSPASRRTALALAAPDRPVSVPRATTAAGRGARATRPSQPLARPRHRHAARRPRPRGRSPRRGGACSWPPASLPGKRTHTRLLLLLVRERRWARSYERVGSAVRVDRFRGGASWPLLSGRGNCPATLDWIYDFTLAPAACPNPTPIHKFSWSA
jgi:hypothetical protein